MTFKFDEHLCALAAIAGVTPNRYCEMLTEEFRGLIPDDKENYGEYLCFAIDGETPLATIDEIMKKTGIERMNETTHETLMHLTVMGDGDCPICGGTMELSNCVGHYQKGDRTTPPDYDIDFEYYDCNVCGHRHVVDCRPDNY